VLNRYKQSNDKLNELEKLCVKMHDEVERKADDKLKQIQREDAERLKREIEGREC